MKSSFIHKIPELSNRNFGYASYVCGLLITASSIFFIYEMFTTEDFGINVQWNIFTSTWFPAFFVLGLLLAIVNWGKFGHWSFKTVNVYKDRYGNRREEESSDITDTMMGGCLMPLLGHFLIEPVIYACLIYYPLMCILALLGIVLPYVISLMLIGIAIVIFMSSRFMTRWRCHSLILIITTCLISGGLIWSSISMAQAKASSTDVINDTDMFNNPQFNEPSDDDMFRENYSDTHITP